MTAGTALRSWFTGCLLLCWVCVGAAHAQINALILLDSAHPSLQIGGTLEVLTESGPSAGIDTISKKSRASFSPLPADHQFGLRDERTLWIRLRLQRDAGAPADWTLHLPLPYLDYAALYQPNAKGGWNRQLAGDTTAVAQWDHPSLYPDFAITLPEQGVHEVYLEVRNFKSAMLPLRLATKSVRDRQQELENLGLGTLMGMLLMLVGVCAIHYLQSRSAVDGWYTGYAVLVSLVTTNATGLSGMWLWPTSPLWSNYAHMALPVLGVGGTLLFVRHLSSLDVGYPRLAKGLYACGLASMPIALLTAAIDRQIADYFNSVYLTAGPILTVMCTALTWRRGYAVSKWLFMAYVPQALAVLVLVAQMWHLIPDWWQARYMLVLAIAITVPLLQQALHTRIRERREAEERAKALPTQDALTGLLTAPLLQQQVAHAVNRARHDGEPSAIVLVDVVNFKFLRESYGDAVAEQCLLRAAVKLHRVLRDVDPAGRLDTARFGLVLDGVTDRQVLTERMVRLIASGLIPLPGLKPEVTLQFHVACVLLHEVIPSADSILEELGNVLEGISPRTRRPIRFLEAPHTEPAPLSSLHSRHGASSEMPTQPNA
nr:7TM diverse intracellular signaling domain-containing protein [uncultured Rhodoferax sp.]